jgi:hypothetical protein
MFVMEGGAPANVAGGASIHADETAQPEKPLAHLRFEQVTAHLRFEQVTVPSWTEARLGPRARLLPRAGGVSANRDPDRAATPLARASP